MSLELYKNLLEEIGEYLFYVLLYNWGEPLLNKKLPQMIKKAKTYDIFTEVHTNLSLPLTDDEIQSILRSGVDEIAASIDGFSKKTYQTYRRGGNFELVKSNIQRLAVARDRLGLETSIIWNFLVFSFNEHEIDATRSYCQQNGIVFNQRDAFIDKEKHADWFPSYRKSELEAKKEWGKKETDEKTLPTSTQIETRSAHTVRHKTCSWHYAMSVVNADGSVSPCCAPWNQKYDCGKIEKSTKFSEIWNNTYYRRSRASFVGKPLDDFGNVETLCEKCPYDESIQNLYMHLNYEVERRFWELFRNKDPTLEGAFSRLNDPSAFIEYCDQHAINKRGLIW